MPEERPKVRVVLDTNIYVSSVFWLGKPHQTVGMAIDRKIVAYTSPEILSELERILKKDFLEDHDFIERQIALILEHAKIVQPASRMDIVKEDPEDNKIIECALLPKPIIL